MMEGQNESDNTNGDYEQFTIQILRGKTRQIISQALNPVKIIRTDTGLSRDWCGLAELCNLTNDSINNIKCDQNPTEKVLGVWREQDPKKCTIKQLITFLEILDRFDVVADIENLIDEDIKDYKLQSKVQKKPDLGVDRFAITQDDVERINRGLKPQNYDAFVLFADDDIDFANKVIETMEKEYNFRFCTKQRDLLGGVLEFKAITKLISERCTRLIVILSAAFIDSQANTFFMNFAQSLGIEQSQRKVIPCVYKSFSPFPVELRCLYVLDYTRSGKLWNFWDRLRDAINAPDQGVWTNPLEDDKNDVMKMSVTARENNNLKVKFNSTGNLNKTTVVENPLSPSTSTNNTIACPENDTTKKLSFNKFLSKIRKKNGNNTRNTAMNGEGTEHEKKKKKKNKIAFWGNNNKMKAMAS